MDIILNRESVCMGDDIDDHTLIYTIDSLVKFSDMFQNLIKKKYFPNISGNDVVWTLCYGEKDLISWKTKENKLYSRFAAEEPAILDWVHAAPAHVHFRYYSPPAKRAQQIFRMFGGSKFHIWHEGFMPEYETYCIPQAVEEDWRKALICPPLF